MRFETGLLARVKEEARRISYAESRDVTWTDLVHEAVRRLLHNGQVTLNRKNT